MSHADKCAELSARILEMSADPATAPTTVVCAALFQAAGAFAIAGAIERIADVLVGLDDKLQFAIDSAIREEGAAQ